MNQPPLLGGNRLVCVDGPAGSGKTTFAEDVRVHAHRIGLSAVVVHLDDLYVGWEQDLAAVGPLLRNHVVGPLASRHVGRYHRFDWHIGALADWVVVPTCEVLIIEGVAASSPDISSRRATLVWIEADRETCLARGLRRDGEAMRSQWRDWQDREAAYFSATRPAELADFIQLTSDGCVRVHP